MEIIPYGVSGDISYSALHPPGQAGGVSSGGMCKRTKKDSKGSAGEERGVEHNAITSIGLLLRAEPPPTH